MHIVIAPNAFKNSLSATDAAKAIKEGLLLSKLDCSCTCFPVGDGGDGTGELIIHHSNGTVVPATVYDPLGRKINSSFGLIDNGKTAVIEMANASGLRLLKQEELNPLKTNSYGTGELITAALNNGVNKIILCIGGTATVDGGTGILQALGLRFLNVDGNELTTLPEQLDEVDKVDTTFLDKRIFNCEIIILCDVENTLLGNEGAARVFGPQKGADAAMTEKLETLLINWKNVLLRQTGKDISMIKHGGAAGGVAATMQALFNARLVNGIEEFLRLTHFDEALNKADVVFTGEGSIDEQTLQGKGPFGVAKKAKEKNIPVIGLAGKIPSPVPASLQTYFDSLISINSEPVDITTTLKNTYQNLERTATMVGNNLHQSSIH
ncbi:MAG: glycerate kinase [Sphingobacteriales bacterium]|nr:glycerate kinase [Sphingobacteriales bacterium]MBI3719837.1 glycerate kinase [Sphingobacteriales bacterium]